MNLTVDIGNSSSKLALFDGDQIMKLLRTTKTLSTEIKDLAGQYDIQRMIVSDVSSRKDENRQDIISTGILVHFLSCESRFPFEISYSTPETLGTDRLAAVAGAYKYFPGNNVLVIDAGTAVTYDLLLSSGEYPGGNISPGMLMRFKALHNYTGKLPLVTRAPDFRNPGNDTVSAIRAGVEMGLVFEINEYIRTFIESYNELKVIMTGGDSKVLSERIKFSYTFAPDLITEGLNYLIRDNA